MSDSFAKVLRDVVEQMKTLNAQAAQHRAAEAGRAAVTAAAVRAIIASHPEPAAFRASWDAEMQQIEPQLSALGPEGESAAQALQALIQGVIAPALSDRH